VNDEYDTPKDLINHVPLSDNTSPITQDVSCIEFRPRGFSNNSFKVTSLKARNDDLVAEEVPYTDPRDSKLYTQPGVDPFDSEIYKVYVTNEALYCRPYQEGQKGGHGKSIMLFINIYKTIMSIQNARAREGARTLKGGRGSRRS